MTATITAKNRARAKSSVPTRSRMAGEIHRSLTTTLGRIVVALIVLLWTVPTAGLIVSSFRPEREIKTSAWWRVFSDPTFTLRNYRDVLSSKSSGGQLANYFWNSVKIALPATVIPILIAAFAAYAFSWMSFRGRDFLFLATVALLVVPLQMAFIPMLRLINTGVHIGDVPIFPALGILQNNVRAVWLAHTAFAMPLAVYLLRNFIGALPGELMEAARVDGASHMRIFLRIVLPLSVPALASLAIFQFLWVWNDLAVATAFAPTRQLAPMTVKLVELAGSKGEEWQRLTAGAFVTMFVPMVVFFSLQRFFVRGLVTGSVKG